MKRIRVAYISKAFFSDVDLSFLSEMKNYADVDYYLQLDTSLCGAAVMIKEKYPHHGVFPASVYPQFAKFDKLFPVKNMYVVNNPTPNAKSLFVQSYRLTKHLRKENYDLIHITDVPRLCEPWLFTLRSKVLLSVHDPFSHSSEVSLYNNETRRRIAFSALKYFVIFNRAQREDFIQHYKLKSNNVFNSLLGAYTYLSMYEGENLQERSNPYILFFGQITPHKGVEYLVDAVRDVRKRYPDWTLVVAGRAKNGFDIFKISNVEGVEIINKFIPENELAALIRNSQFVVCPYLDATQSGVVMSSYAFCKPVIVTNVGGLAEMAGNGELGLVVPPADSKALADAILSLIENPNELTRFSDAIRDVYFNGEKSWGCIARNLFNDCYKVILKGICS